MGALALFVQGFTRGARGESSEIPPELQAELLAKLVTYDRNFAERAGDVARVVAYFASGNARSSLAANTFRSALAKLGQLGSRSLEVSVRQYESATAVARECESEKLAIVYVTPGLDDEVPAIRTALTEGNVLTVAPVPRFVPMGIVLGFELVSGRPKLLLNLTQAKKQNVAFSAHVLKLMKVYR